MIHEIKGIEDYEASVLNSTGPVLVDFWGPACRPCLALMPTIENLAQNYEGKVKVCKVNAADNRRLCINLKVISLPTFILYNNGQEIRRLGPDVTREDIVQAFAELANYETRFTKQVI